MLTEPGFYGKTEFIKEKEPELLLSDTEFEETEFKLAKKKYGKGAQDKD